MSQIDHPVGFYGKLPSHGDFVSRRLPRQFVELWDSWLQGGLSASREQLGADWLDSYLVSPIWQFTLAPGLCGADAWAGVMMPSVDRVGRYFPLTLAANIAEEQRLGIYGARCSWLNALSELALSSLDYQFDLQIFDDKLQRTRLADFECEQLRFPRSFVERSATRLAFFAKINGPDGTAQMLESLAREQGSDFLNHCSIWRSLEDGEGQVSVLVCEGLPPFDAFVGFLDGNWLDRGWSLARMSPGNAELLGSVPVLEADQSSAALNDDNDDATLPPILPSSNDASGDSFGLSVVGLRRRLNEDAILQRPEAGMWVVADGMGGHSAGDVASQAVATALAKVSPVANIDCYCELATTALYLVNRDLMQLAQNRGVGHIIGSTVVVLLICDNKFAYLWAGDSRLYRYRQSVLQQLTTDHSLFNESISLGLEPLDGSMAEGRGNVITRAVGADLQLQLDCGQGQVEQGDLFVLTSDGIDKELSHDDICALCAKGTAKDIAESLVREAEQRGGRDNISVIVVKR